MNDWTASSPAITPPTSSSPPSTNQKANLNIDSQTPAPTRTPLFALPTEMRVGIFELTLLDDQSAAPSLSLLQTCRQVSMEARSTLYKRPTSFNSQAKLFDWIDRSRKQDLKRVRTLTLRLTDIDLSDLLDQSLSSAGKTRGGVWSSYQSELERLDNALRSLPNLASLTLVPPTIRRSQLLKGLYHSFLALVPKRCPRLKHLELQHSEDILETVPSLSGVSGVTFTGGTLIGTETRKRRYVGSEKIVAINGLGRSHMVPVKEGSISPRSNIEKARPRRTSQRVDGLEVDRRA